MNRRMIFPVVCLTAIAWVASLTSCGKPAPTVPSAPTTAAPAAPGSGDALPAELFTVAEPPDAVNIKAARESAKPGDRVVLRGRIGGAVNPFVDERAVFTLVDLALPTCADNPDDGCKTPWDYCCERREDIRAHAATIQVVSPAPETSNQPLKVPLRDVNGLKPMAEVVVVGTVVEADAAGPFTVNAESFYVTAK